MDRLCKDCKHFGDGQIGTDNFKHDARRYDYCLHPKNLGLVRGLSDDSPFILRQNGHFCGQNGNGWEPK